jgi:hypothetical protein
MLIRNHVIFVIGIERTMLRRDVYLLSGKFYPGEVLE